MSETERDYIEANEVSAIEDEPPNARPAILAGLRRCWAASQAGDEVEASRIAQSLHDRYGFTALAETVLGEISSGRNRHLHEEENHG